MRMSCPERTEVIHNLWLRVICKTREGLLTKLWVRFSKRTSKQQMAPLFLISDTAPNWLNCFKKAYWHTFTVFTSTEEGLSVGYIT